MRCYFADSVLRISWWTVRPVPGITMLTNKLTIANPSTLARKPQIKPLLASKKHFLQEAEGREWNSRRLPELTRLWVWCLLWRSSWLLPGGVLLLSVSSIVSSKPSLPFKPVPSDRGSASPPCLHSPTLPSLMSRLDWRLTWLTSAFYLYFWDQMFFLILTSCTKYTSDTSLSLLPNTQYAPWKAAWRREKGKDLKSDKPGSAIQLLYACGSFLLTHFTELRGFNDIITE